MKKIVLLLISAMLLGCLGIFAVNAAKEATPVLSLEAEDGSLGGNAYVYGFKVGNVGKCGTDVEGTVTFDGLNVPEDGTYTLMLYYCSGSDDRNFDIRTDAGNFHIECPNTGSFDTVGTIMMEVEVTRGGYIELGSDWYGPDLDKIEFYHTDAFAFENKVYENPDNQTVGTGDVKLVLDQNNGVYSLLAGNSVVLANAHAEIEVGGNMVASDMFENHTVSIDGNTVIFTHTDLLGFSGQMVQTFTLKDGYVVTKVSVTSPYEISTNFISAMAVYQNSIAVDNGIFLQMPFDNDMWGEPKFIGAYDLGHTTKSYEVGAYFNAETGAGLVFGSVEHDLWKTGVNINAENGSIMGLTVFGGVADSATRDNSPHGMVSGTEISSPLTFIGCFDSWKDGLTAFGKANTDVVPAKVSTSKAPFGFNSWGTLQSTVKYSQMCAISDYIKEYLQPAWGDENAAVYVNIDSYWDYIAENDYTCTMTLDEALAAFAALCKENGQTAGIYFTPFAVWMDIDTMSNTKMEGSNYTFLDAALHRNNGELYGTLDGGYALDATHPGTIARIKDRINYFISLGFGYLKLDFLTHGALEGDHYDNNIQTGMQAYNAAMAEIHNLCNGKMFVNLSIAPVFPYQYADGRRISCDAFASLDNTKHVLTNLTACFWHKEIYTYPDPDHLVVWGSYEGDAKARVTSGVITGTSFLLGDNLSDITPGDDKHKFILKLLANPNIIKVAQMAKTFRPLENLPEERYANAYYYASDDALYVAVFNFDIYDAEISLDLSLTGADVGSFAAELWSGKRFSVEDGKLNLTMNNEDALIFKITKTEAGLADVVEIKDEDLGITPKPPIGSDDKDTTEKPEDEIKKPADKSEKNGSNNAIVIIIAIAVLAIASAGIAFFAATKVKKTKK